MNSKLLKSPAHHGHALPELSERVNVGWNEPSDVRSDHELLNRVVYSESQRARVESERPVAGVPIATDSGWMLAAYRMPGGYRHVTLIDGTEAVWEAYCAEVRIRNGCAVAGDADLALGRGNTEGAR